MPQRRGAYRRGHDGRPEGDEPPHERGLRVLRTVPEAGRLEVEQRLGRGARQLGPRGVAVLLPDAPGDPGVVPGGPDREDPVPAGRARGVPRRVRLRLRRRHGLDALRVVIAVHPDALLPRGPASRPAEDRGGEGGEAPEGGGSRAEAQRGARAQGEGGGAPEGAAREGTARAGAARGGAAQGCGGRGGAAGSRRLLLLPRQGPRGLLQQLPPDGQGPAREFLREVALPLRVLWRHWALVRQRRWRQQDARWHQERIRCLDVR
mmetsp:Transcript_64086/g.179101  ORF Transcript_64086/g.179101 Transcript_64086/m.179101 type:complete len:263 (-) Transcript_64086:109-897(-)